MRTVDVTFSLAKTGASCYQEHIKTETPAFGKVRTHVEEMFGINFLTERPVFMKMGNQRDKVRVCIIKSALLLLEILLSKSTTG